MSTRNETFLRAATPFWHPVARASDVGSGDVEAVTLLGEELVVFRGHDGVLAALEDRCPHRGTRLSRGDVTAEGCIRCPYHGWEYGTDGECVAIPQLPDGPILPRTRAVAYRAVEQAGLVWVCLASPGEEARGVPSLPEAREPGMHVYVGAPIDWACQSTRQVENFCDIAHFSFVHLDLFGNPDACEVEPHTVVRSDDGSMLMTEVVYQARYQHLPPDAAGFLPVVPTRFSYRLELPFTVHLISTTVDVPYVLLCANQPVSVDRCRVFWVLVIPDGLGLSDEMLEEMERQVFLADRAVVETQRPLEVPLDPGAELQLPFDRMAIAYRRALVELGFP